MSETVERHPWKCDCAACWAGITEREPKPKTLFERMASHGELTMSNCETEGHIWDGRPGRDFSCEKCGAPYAPRAAIAALNQPNESTEVEALREAVEQAAVWFDEYADLHAKTLLPEHTPDVFFQPARTDHNNEVRDKIERNRNRAATLRAALTGSNRDAG